MEEYLTVSELSEKIKFSRQSLYNLIHKGTFVLGKHYLKPTPKKVLFKWREIRIWMGDELHHHEALNSEEDTNDLASGGSETSAPPKPPSLINI